MGATILLRARVIGDEPVVCHRISEHLINAPTSNIGQQKWGREDGMAMRSPRPSVSVIRQVAQVTNINGKKWTNLEPSLGRIH